MNIWVSLKEFLLWTHFKLGRNAPNEIEKQYFSNTFLQNTVESLTNSYT